MSTKADKATKDKAMAAFMRSHGVMRRTGQCAVCNTSVAVGGTALLTHLNTSCRPRLWGKRDRVNSRGGGQR